MTAPAGYQVSPMSPPPGGGTPPEATQPSSRPINVQTMHIYGSNDEQSILDTLAFMDPGSSW